MAIELTESQLEQLLDGNIYLKLGSIAWQLVELLFGIPDPLDLLFGAFSGRPTMDATIQEAQLLKNYGSPVLMMLALGAGKAVTADIPLSDPAVGPIFGPYFEAARALQDVIRWQSTLPNIQAIDATTLSHVMHEAGNQPDAGTATIDAVQAAWDTWRAQSHVHDASWNIINGYQSSSNLLLAGWAKEWITPSPGSGDSGSGGNSGGVNNFDAYGDFWHTYDSIPARAGQAAQAIVHILTQAESRAQAAAQLNALEIIPGRYFEHRLGHDLGLVTDGQYAAIHGFFVNNAPADAGSGNTQAVNDFWNTLNDLQSRNVTAYNAVVNIMADTQLRTDAATQLHNLQIIPGRALEHKLGDDCDAMSDAGYTALHQWFYITTAADHIVISPPDRTTVDGIVHLTAQINVTPPVTQAPLWDLDARLYGRSNPQNWDTRGVLNGQHTVQVNFILPIPQPLYVSKMITLNVHNQTGTPPPTGHGQWFNVCAEAIDCLSVSDDFRLLAQQMSNVANATAQAAQALGAESACCVQLVQQLTNISTALTNLVTAATNDATAAAVQHGLDCICNMLIDIFQQLHADAPHIAAIDANIHALLAPLEDIATKTQPLDLSKLVAELKRLNDDKQSPETWITALVNSGAVPRDLVPLLQGTTWEKVHTVVMSIVGWILGLGEEASNVATERIFRYIIVPLSDLLWKIMIDLSSRAAVDIKPLLESFGAAAKIMAADVDAALTGIIGVAATEMVKAYEADIGEIDTTSEAGVLRATGLLLGRAVEFGSVAHISANLMELSIWTKNLGLNETSAIIAELAGFREVLINTHRPFLQTKLGIPARYMFNRKYPTTLPQHAQALQMWARGHMTDGDAQYLVRSGGISDSYDSALFRSAYHPISVRALATLMQDQPLDRAKMRDVLQDNGYLPTHVELMLDELDYASTKNVRNAYVNEAISAYQHGIMPDDELNQLLDNLGWSSQAKHFVFQRAMLARRLTLAQKVTGQVVPLVAAGSISPDDGLHQLEAAGLQSWYAQLEVTLAETKAVIHRAKLEASAEERQIRTTRTHLIRAAIAEYEAGRIDTAGLEAALRLIP